MKKTVKKILCVVLVAAICAAFAGCAKMNYVTNATIGAINEIKAGTWNQTKEEEGADEDKPVIDELKAGTYGGVDFKTNDDVAKYYVEAYNYTKTLTATYLDKDGKDCTYYKLLGDEDLKVDNIHVDGQKNSTINSLVPGIVNGLFKAGVYGLVPCNNRDPKLDNNSEGVKEGKEKNAHDYRTSTLTGDDILASNVKDNKDGTITLTIQPKAAEMSMRGDDSQGRFFEVLGDIGGAVSQITLLTWAEGDAKDNVKVNYKGGTGTIKINTSTKEIVEADYQMNVKVAVSHANVTVIRNKNATLDITYKNHYPASADYIYKSKQIKLK